MGWPRPQIGEERKPSALSSETRAGREPHVIGRTHWEDSLGGPSRTALSLGSVADCRSLGVQDNCVWELHLHREPAVVSPLPKSQS